MRTNLADNTNKYQSRFSKIKFFIFILLIWIILSILLVLFTTSILERDVSEDIDFTLLDENENFDLSINRTFSKTNDYNDLEINHQVLHEKCELIRLRFKPPGVCYKSSENKVLISLISFGKTVSSAMINIISDQRFIMHDVNLNLAIDDAYELEFDYNIDNLGFIELVEVVPRLIDNGVEYHCEPSKILKRNILSC